MDEVQKEKLRAFWQDVVKETGLQLHFRERMEEVQAQGDTFIVTTNLGRYHARSVLLAIGRRGTPRKLGVAGEERPKVVYRLVDAEQYRGQAVLVVGGGDSALEAAIALADEPGTTVTLSYRSAGFSRVKPGNSQRLQTRVDAGRVQLMLQSQVESIEEAHVSLRTETGVLQLPNQAVIVCAGGELPTALLQRVGVHFETKHGTA